MSLQEHTITVGLVTKTLAEWGLESAIVTTRDTGRDDLLMTAERGVAQAPIWAMNSTLILKDEGGTVRWRGTVGLPRKSARRGRQTHSYSAQGLPWYLDRLIYRQQWPFPTNPDDPLGAQTLEFVSQLILHRESGAGEATAKVNVREQVRAILDYAIEAGVPMGYSTIGIPDNVEPPEDEQLDLRISDALDCTLGWVPDVQRHVHYTENPQRLVFTRAHFSGSTVSVHGPSYFQRRSIDLTQLEDVDVQGRDDLLIPRMRITYIVTNQAGEQTWRSVVRDESEVDNGGWGTSESTVQLRGLIWDGSGFTAPEPLPPSGLAESLHRGFSRLLYEVSFARTTDSLQWDLYPGELWHISGAGEDLEESLSLCKEISRDLKSGKVTVKCGLGTTLGLSGRLQLLRPNRKRQVPQNASEQSYGFGDENEKENSRDLACDVKCNASSSPIDPGDL